MNANAQAKLCSAFLYASMADKPRNKQSAPVCKPVVTISREAGARANSVAQALVSELDASKVIPKNRPWTVFNQDLLDYCIHEHHLPERTSEYFPEDKPEEIRALIGELLGLHAGLYTDLHKVAESIRRLAEAGNAIIVGRGANMVSADLKHAVHIRLVGDKKNRVRHFAKLHNLSLEKAADEVAKRDRARKRYLKANFKCDIDDPCIYDLVINTDRYTDDAVAKIIRTSLEQKYH